MMAEELLVKMVLDAWQTYLKRTDDLFQSLSDEQLMQQVAPQRNTALYLLGHLTAIHDRMLPLLRLGDVLYPSLYDPFVEQPDGPQVKALSTEDLRKAWKKVNETLVDRFAMLTPNEWFERHTAVSEEAFAKETHRNRLNLVINRTNHLATHLGQLLLLKNDAE